MLKCVIVTLALVQNLPFCVKRTCRRSAQVRTPNGGVGRGRGGGVSEYCVGKTQTGPREAGGRLLMTLALPLAIRHALQPNMRIQDPQDPGTK